MTTPQDDDLQDCLAFQPKPQPQPKPKRPKLTENINSRLSTGKASVPTTAPRKPVPEIPDTVPVKAPLPPRPKWFGKKPLPPIPGHLLFKLDDLTRSRAASERLVQQIQRVYPDKSPKWCAEKALWDLRRDRY